MTVILIIDSLNKGGKEKQVSYLVEGLEKRNINYFIVLRFDKTKYAVNRNRVIVLKNKRGVKLFKELRSIFLKTAPTIIHSWEGYLSFFCLMASAGLDIKFIDGSIQFAKHYPFKNPIRFRTWFVNKFVDKTVANSKAGLAAFNFKESGKNRVIPNGFDFDAARKITMEEDSAPNRNHFVIGMVAGFSPAKDYPTLIKVAGRLLNNGFDIKLILVGDGLLLDRYKQLVSQEHVDRIVFTGLQQDPLKWIQLFDVGVLLSKKGHSEGMSNAIMEYMALKKPVIVTRTGGNPELVADGKMGFMIGFEDKHALYQKLLELMTDRKKRQQMGGTGYDYLKNHHDLDAYVNNWVALYSELIPSVE